MIKISSLFQILIMFVFAFFPSLFAQSYSIKLKIAPVETKIFINGDNKKIKKGSVNLNV